VTRIHHCFLLYYQSNISFLPTNLHDFLLRSRYAYQSHTSCTFLESKYNHAAFQIVFMLTSYVIPLTIICFLYFGMLFRLWESVASSGASRLRGKKRVTRMIVVVVGVFAVCWLPIQTVLLLKSLYLWDTNDWTVAVQITSHVLGYMNSCVNPILYAFLGRDFRKSFTNLIPCKLCLQCHQGSMRRRGPTKPNGNNDKKHDANPTSPPVPPLIGSSCTSSKRNIVVKRANNDDDENHHHVSSRVDEADTPLLVPSILQLHPSTPDNNNKPSSKPVVNPSCSSASPPHLPQNPSPNLLVDLSDPASPKNNQSATTGTTSTTNSTNNNDEVNNHHHVIVNATSTTSANSTTPNDGGVIRRLVPDHGTTATTLSKTKGRGSDEQKLLGKGAHQFSQHNRLHSDANHPHHLENSAALILNYNTTQVTIVSSQTSPLPRPRVLQDMASTITCSTSLGNNGDLHTTMNVLGSSIGANGSGSKGSQEEMLHML